MIRIIAFLCARLRRATNLVEDSTFLNVPSRLAKQLIALLEGAGPRDATKAAAILRISQDELARTLGARVSSSASNWRSGERRALSSWGATA
jgi:hypothetical protein